MDKLTKKIIIKKDSNKAKNKVKEVNNELTESINKIKDTIFNNTTDDFDKILSTIITELNNNEKMSNLTTFIKNSKQNIINSNEEIQKFFKDNMSSIVKDLKVLELKSIINSYIKDQINKAYREIDKNLFYKKENINKKKDKLKKAHVAVKAAIKEAAIKRAENFLEKTKKELNEANKEFTEHFKNIKTSIDDIITQLNKINQIFEYAKKIAKITEITEIVEITDDIDIVDDVKTASLDIANILHYKYNKEFIDIPQPSNLENVKLLCGKCFDFIFSKANSDQKKIIVEAFSSIMNYIYYYFDITKPTINEAEVEKFDLNNIDSRNKIPSKFVLSVNDYYEVLMMLFPYIDDWNKLKNVENLEDLFKIDKYNKFVINNQNIKSYNLDKIIKIKENTIRTVLNFYHHSFYPNWYTIYPIPIQDEIDTRINDILKDDKFLALNYEDRKILINLRKYYATYDNSHILNKFTKFDITVNNKTITIDHNYVKRLFNNLSECIDIINNNLLYEDIIKDITDNVTKKIIIFKKIMLESFSISVNTKKNIEFGLCKKMQIVTTSSINTIKNNIINNFKRQYTKWNTKSVNDIIIKKEINDKFNAKLNEIMKDPDSDVNFDLLIIPTIEDIYYDVINSDLEKAKEINKFAEDIKKNMTKNDDSIINDKYDIDVLLHGLKKQYVNYVMQQLILLTTVYKFVSGILSKVILEESKQPNIKNETELKKYDQCYHFLKGVTYEELKKNNNRIIKESIEQMTREKKDVNKYKQELIDGDFQFGDINSLRNIYAVRWTSQLKLFTNYLNSNVMFITGGTGVGKSTQIPKLISYCSVAIDNKPNGRTVCTQPRIQPTQSMIYIARQMGIIIPYGKNKSAYKDNKVCDDNAQYYSSEDPDKQIDNITSPVFKMETDKSLYNQIIKRGDLLLDNKLIMRSFKNEIKQLMIYPHIKYPSFNGSEWYLDGKILSNDAKYYSTIPSYYKKQDEFKLDANFRQKTSKEQEESIIDAVCNDEVVKFMNRKDNEYYYMPKSILDSGKEYKMESKKYDILIKNKIATAYTKNKSQIEIINMLSKYSEIDYISKYAQYHNIIIDEVHEHNFNMDTLLCLLNYYLSSNVYKLFIITATFDSDEVSFRKYFKFKNENFIDNRCHFSEPFKTTTYNIIEQYENKISSVTQLSDDVKNDKILSYINSLTDYGDIIVFKAGSAEVNKCVNFLNDNMKDDTTIAIPFFSQMNESLKDYVKGKSHAKMLSKKLITNELIDVNNYIKETDAKVYNHYVLVATNIAEASITIDALTHVIDDGLQKKKIFNYETFTDDKLELKPIGETNRLQRKGRVGRRGDGTAYFLYKKGTLLKEKPIYAITTDDIRPFIFNCLNNESENTTDLTIPVDQLIFNSKFYIQHPLIGYENKKNKMIQILSTYKNFGIITNSYTKQLVKTDFGLFINALLIEMEDVTLQETISIIGASTLRCLESMIGLICTMKLRDSITITSIIHQFGGKEDKSDFIILKKYFDSLERFVFGGKIKDYIFDKVNSITIEAIDDDDNNKSEFFQILQQVKAIRSEFTSKIIRQLLTDLANEDNAYLNIYANNDDFLNRIKITDKVIELATEYFKLKAPIILTCLLYLKTIDNEKVITNKLINEYYDMSKYDIKKYIPNLQLVSPLSKYDRLTYLLTYFNYQNIYMNVTSINNTLNKTSYLNIASGLIAHNNNYSYNVVIPHKKYGAYSFNSLLNPSMQYDSLFVYIPSVMPRKRTTYINGVIDEIEISVFNFKHNINNSLIPLLPDTIKKIYKTWTNITPEQKEYIDIIKKYQ